MENTTKIKIGNNDYHIKTSLRSLIIFEELTGKNVNSLDNSISDTIKLFYSVVKANNKEFTLDYDSFIDLLDDNQDSITEFSDFLKSQANQQPTDTKKKVVKK